MSRNLLTIIFLLSFLFLGAQNKNDEQIKKIDSLGFAFESIPNYDSALHYYRILLDFYLSKKDHKEAGRGCLKIGRILSEKGDVANASKVFFEMLNYSKLANDTVRVAIAYTRIGRCYEFLGNTNKALEYYREGLNLAEKFSIHKQIIPIYNAICAIYLSQNKLKECKSMALKADSLANLINDPYFRYGADNLLGLYYSAEGDFILAERYMAAALDYNIKKNPLATHTAGTYFNLGDIYSRQKKYDKAIDYYKKSFAIFIRQNEKKNLRDLSFNIASAYAEKGDYRKAFEYQKTYESYKDSVMNDETNRTIAELETKYEVQQKDNKILSMDKQRLLNEEKIRTTRNAMFLYMITALLLAVILIAALLFFRQRRRTEKAEQLQRLTLTKLQTQMNPHLVFNAMVSIQDLILRNENNRACEAISSFSKLMRQTLNNSDHMFISLEKEIEFLKSYVDFENKRGFVKTLLKVHVEDKLELEHILIAPMLLQPLIENAFKHAFKNEPHPFLNLVVRKKAYGLLSIIIEDNGSGLQKNGVQHHVSKATGIIRNRIEEIYKSEKINYEGIKFRLENRLEGKGCLAEIVLPLKENW